MDNINSGLNTQGESKVIEEIKNYAKNLGIDVDQKQVNINVTVTPTNDFIVKVAQNSYTQSAMQTAIEAAFSAAASLGANT